MSHTTCEEDIKMIEVAVLSIEHTKKSVVQGSDAHLDLILEIQKGLSESAELIKKAVEDIEKNFNSYTADNAKKILAKISPIFGLAKNINAVFASGIHNELIAHLTNFNNEVRELAEMTNDLSRYKIEGSSDYNSLFND